MCITSLFYFDPSQENAVDTNTLSEDKVRYSEISFLPFCVCIRLP